MSEIPVVAAVPTYNMASDTTSTVSRLLRQELDGIFVLDDNSTDNTPSHLKKVFGDEIRVIEGEENLGSAGNRNRILGELSMAGYPLDTAIVFIDADMSYHRKSPPMAPVVRELLRRYPDAGMIGGKILNAAGNWGAFNFGPPFSMRFLRGLRYQHQIEQYAISDPYRAVDINNAHADLLQGWTNPFENPVQPATVGWLAEAFTFITFETFAEMGGYDPAMRYCEGIDFGARMRKAGKELQFDPTLTVRHKQTDIRGEARKAEVLKAGVHLAMNKLTGKY